MWNLNLYISTKKTRENLNYSPTATVAYLSHTNMVLMVKDEEMCNTYSMNKNLSKPVQNYSVPLKDVVENVPFLV